MSLRAWARWHAIPLRRRLEIARGAADFLGIPETWYDCVRWRCRDGHVVTWLIKSEGLGRDACPACFAPVRITHPTDATDPGKEPPHRRRWIPLMDARVRPDHTPKEEP